MSDDGRFLSTVQVAKAVGVSVTTIKRWVDEGILPAHRTAGGHRKLILADVLRLTREGGLPSSNLGELVPIVRGEALEPDQYCEQLIEAARALDEDRIRAVIHSAYRSGIPIETLADRIIAPTMAHIGHRWEQNKIDVSTEHLVTGAMVAGLYELHAVLAENAAENRPVAIGGAPEGDHYIMPSLLAKMTLIEAGWEALNIGPNTPVQSFLNLFDTRNPKLLWLSISHVVNRETFERDMTILFNEARQRGIPVAIGGQALSKELRSNLPYTAYGDGFTQLAAFARTLNPPAQRPKRGRPPGSSSATST